LLDVEQEGNGSGGAMKVVEIPTSMANSKWVGEVTWAEKYLTRVSKDDHREGGEEVNQKRGHLETFWVITRVGKGLRKRGDRP